MSSEVALTPADAADLLGLLRPFLVRLLEDGSIPSQTFPQCKHRNVSLSDVIAFQAQRSMKGGGRMQIMAIVEGTVFNTENGTCLVLYAVCLF